MSNTFNMARLDFYTLKSQMTTYMVIPTVALFFSLTGLSLSALGFTAAWLVLIVNQCHDAGVKSLVIEP